MAYQATNPAAVAAATIIFNGGQADNDNSNAVSTVPTAVANLQALAAAIGHAHWACLAPVNQAAATLGNIGWAENRILTRALTTAFNAQLINQQPTLERANNGSAQDLADIANDVESSSVRTQTNGTVDTGHPGRRANLQTRVPQYFLPVALALEGHGIFVSPDQEIQVVGDAAATAQS